MGSKAKATGKGAAKATPARKSKKGATTAYIKVGRSNVASETASSEKNAVTQAKRADYGVISIRPLPRKAELHVIPLDRGWGIKGAGKSIAEKSFPTQTAALKVARRMLSNKGGQLVIHQSDGRVRDVDNFGARGLVQDPPRTGRLSRSEVRDAVWNATKGVDFR